MSSDKEKVLARLRACSIFGWQAFVDALFGDGGIHSAMDAQRRLINLLEGDHPTEEDRETLRWVRDQGGLKEVRKRIMPEGYEWPCYESGELVVFGDEASRLGEDFKIHVVCLYSDGSYSLNFNVYLKGERVRRPAPKVLDADGVEIRVGDTVWATNGHGPFEVTRIVNADRLRVICDDEKNGHLNAYPEMLTHRAPILAADGKPLEVGQTVWHVDTGEEFFVSTFAVGLVNVSDNKGGGLQLLSSQLTHHPVLDADCVPIHEGDAVWRLTDGEGPLTVTKFAKPWVRAKSADGREGDYWPDDLTHTKPKLPDSWERIEMDACAVAEALVNEYGGSDPSNTRKTILTLVDRCKNLAEVDSNDSGTD